MAVILLWQDSALGRGGGVVLETIELFGERIGPRPAGGGAQTREVSVAQHTQQVGEVVVAPHEPGTAQHPLVGVLDEILGVLPRPAQPVGGAIETLDMRAQRVRIQPAPRAGLLFVWFCFGSTHEPDQRPRNGHGHSSPPRGESEVA